MCVEHDAFNNRYSQIEIRHKVLVDELKDELYIVILVQQEEECFEVDDMKKKLNDKHKLDSKEEHYDGCG